MTTPPQPVTLEVRVPGMLRSCTDGRGRLTLEAATLEDALQALLATYPRLRTHLFDEQGAQRRHILFFYNDHDMRKLPRLDFPLQPGDRLSVVQAVSGGAPGGMVQD
jgi:molybdopterin synthase sulfur carrier subunit